MKEEEDLRKLPLNSRERRLRSKQFHTRCAKVIGSSSSDIVSWIRSDKELSLLLPKAPRAEYGKGYKIHLNRSFMGVLRTYVMAATMDTIDNLDSIVVPYIGYFHKVEIPYSPNVRRYVGGTKIYTTPFEWETMYLIEGRRNLRNTNLQYEYIKQSKFYPRKDTLKYVKEMKALHPGGKYYRRKNLKTYGDNRDKTVNG